jgi:hypothetical protein
MRLEGVIRLRSALAAMARAGLCTAGILFASPALADGEISIHGQCLDSDGLAVFLSPCDAGQVSQTWGFYDIRNPDYGPAPEVLEPARVDVLVNKRFGRCLDVSGGALERGARVMLWPCTGKKAQRWQRPRGDAASGQLTIAYGLVTKCLAIPEGVFRAGIAPVVSDCHGRLDQTFVYRDLPGRWSIRATADRDACVTTDGRGVFLDRCQVSSPAASEYEVPTRQQRSDQYWAPLQGGALRSAKFPSRCLDVGGAAPADGAPLRLRRCDGGEHQRWTWPAPGATGEIALGAHCLDAAHGRVGAEANLVLSKCDGRASQEFAFADRVVCNSPRLLDGVCVPRR